MSRVKYQDGVITSAITDNFICIICVAYIGKRTGKIDFLQEHLKTEMHINTLKIYKQNFSDDINGTIICKTCNKKLNTKEFFYHSKTHKFQPWYYALTTRFARDFVWHNDRNFYCYICKKTFYYSKVVNIHNKSQTHKEILKRKFPTLKYDLSDSISMIFYKKNNVFPVNDNYCWCWICDVNILTSQISQHSKIHDSKVDQQESESVLSCKSNKQDETIDGDHDDVYDDDKLSSQVPVKLKFLTKYARKSLPFTCGICDIRFSVPEQIQIHCNGLPHNDKLKKLKNKLNTLKDLDDLDLPIGIKLHYHDDDNDDDNDKSVLFECTFCEVKMFTITKLLEHIECIEHSKKMTNIYTESFKFSENSKLPDGILSTAIHNIFYCRLCHFTIRGYNKISCHIQDTEHEQLIMRQRIGLRPFKKQYISEENLKIAKSTNDYPPEIKFISETDNIYENSFCWCTVCSCVLLKPSSADMSLDMKIWTHIVGSNHIKNKKKFNGNNSDVKKREQDKPKVYDDIIISLPIDDLYDVQINDNEKSSATCKPCKFHMYGGIYDIIPDWNHHLSTKNHQQKELEYTKKKYEPSE